VLAPDVANPDVVSIVHAIEDENAYVSDAYLAPVHACQLHHVRHALRQVEALDRSIGIPLWYYSLLLVRKNQTSFVPGKFPCWILSLDLFALKRELPNFSSEYDYWAGFVKFPHSQNAVSQDLESRSKIVLLITWVSIFLEEPD
jgi:hypothetical protein